MCVILFNPIVAGARMPCVIIWKVIGKIYNDAKFNDKKYSSIFVRNKLGRRRRRRKFFIVKNVFRVSSNVSSEFSTIKTGIRCARSIFLLYRFFFLHQLSIEKIICPYITKKLEVFVWQSRHENKLIFPHVDRSNYSIYLLIFH